MISRALIHGLSRASFIVLACATLVACGDDSAESVIPTAGAEAGADTGLTPTSDAAPDSGLDSPTPDGSPDDTHVQTDSPSSSDGDPVDAPTPPPARYFSEDFESPDWDSRFRIFQEENVFREGDVAAHGGSFGIRMHVDIGQHWGGRIGWHHSDRGQTGNYQEIWTRYYIKFGPNFGRDEAIYVGKAGFRARSDEVCNAPCLEMTDSVQHLESNVLLGTSYYHRYVSETDLLNGTFSHHRYVWDSPAGDRERERWYCVETHHVLNEPGNADGVYQNWLDGTLVSDNHAVHYRDSDIFDIDQSVLMVYVGGGWTSDRNMDAYFDDWAVSDEKIGCL